jgi:phosphoribosylamine--glycine ligase
MVDGKNVLPMATSQDHKRALNNDLGPNTGGMGAYSPAPVVTVEIHNRIMNEVIMPTVEGMSAEGAPYSGFLYAGLMIAADGTPNVIEYNCRFGDPETQPIMMRLESDLVELCLTATRGELDKASISFDSRAAVGVVLAANNYPSSYPKGDVISGLATNVNPLAKTFHAGTDNNSDGEIITSGGRVLCATALGNNVTEAQKLAYELVDQITWSGVTYRTDIAYRAIARESLS